IATVLSISQASDNQPKHGQIVRLEHIKSLRVLTEELDKRDFLRGRYIVFPNVSDDGSFSILRKGMASHYKEMPCVGGYVDGSVRDLGSGNRDILAGKATKEYGFKRLAVVQTSD